MDNSDTKMRSALSYIALVSLLGTIGFIFGALNTEDAFADIDDVQLASAIAAPVIGYNFGEVSLSADSAIVLDASTQESLFTLNENAQLPLASLTKVMVALLAHEYLHPTETVIISASSLIPEGESGFVPGESWRARDLIDFTLMTSSNDGAAALAEAVEQKTGTTFDVLMNEKAKSLGLKQTYFINETGLDSSELFSGAYGSAKDMALLFAEVYRADAELMAATAISQHTFSNEQGIQFEATNTNKAVEKLPGLVFGKTGFTDLAGGNLGVLIELEPGHPIVIIVLGSTLTERFEDVVALSETLIANSQK